MADGAGQVARLVRRALDAGAARGAVARWGRVGSRHRAVVEGAASVVPVPAAVTEGTWFDLASLTKPLVTTTLALVAFRSRDFGLRTRIDELLDELRGTTIGALEVEGLLTHTSGLPAWLPLYCLAEGRREALIERMGRVTLEAAPRGTGDLLLYRLRDTRPDARAPRRRNARPALLPGGGVGARGRGRARVLS